MATKGLILRGGIILRAVSFLSILFSMLLNSLLTDFLEERSLSNWKASQTLPGSASIETNQPKAEDLKKLICFKKSQPSAL